MCPFHNRLITDCINVYIHITYTIMYQEVQCTEKSTDLWSGLYPVDLNWNIIQISLKGMNKFRNHPSHKHSQSKYFMRRTQCTFPVKRNTKWNCLNLNLSSIYVTLNLWISLKNIIVPGNDRFYLTIIFLLSCVAVQCSLNLNIL